MTDDTQKAADPDANNPAQSYSITFVNESSAKQDFMIYQRIGQRACLAWFAEPVRTGGNRKYEWRETYGFVWANMPKFAPGNVFVAEETVPASVDYNNYIEFSRRGSDFFFLNANDKGRKGILSIKTTNLVPSRMVALGLSMQNAPMIAFEAGSNLIAEFYVEGLEYWIAAGDYKPGEILDIEQIENKCLVKFDPNIFAVKATLKANNEWTLENEIG